MKSSGEFDAIPYGKQSINENDIEAVVDTLKSDWITQGPAIDKFEQKIAEYCNAEYAVAVSNATAGLHISCLSLGLAEGDLLWTSPNTFVASANCGRYCGAEVDFVDIDPETYNMSVSKLEQKLKEAEATGKLPDVVVPVHFSGQSCEMKPIHELSQQYGFSVIEDASHAIGARYKNLPVGGCSYSDMTVFSFHPVKIITTGEGGVVTTNVKSLYDKLIRYRTHGITKDPVFMSSGMKQPWYYEQLDLGYNYRITDLQAALGNSQMDRLDEFVDRRNELVKRYNRKLKDLPLTLPSLHEDCYSSWHLYVIRLKTDKISKTHSEVFRELRESGIGVNLHYIPVHTQPYYRNLGFDWGDFPNAEGYYRDAISIPLYFDLSYDQQDYIVESLRKMLS